MKLVQNNLIFLVASVICTFIILTTCIYTVKSATGVPYWDMFDGTLMFQTKFFEGDWTALWTPHNEHRIVLGKILFLLDSLISSGTTPFLHIINLLLAAAIAGVLLLFAHEIVGGPLLSIFNLSIVALSFSMAQEQNFSDAFQGQFFLATLLPLLSSYFALLSEKDESRKKTYFIIAIIFAVISILSMANGVFALPMLLVYGIFTGMDKGRIAFLTILSVLGFLVYFYDFNQLSAHNSPLDAIKDPLNLFVFLSVYFGHPFDEMSLSLGHAVGQHGYSIGAGCVIIIATLGAFVLYMPKSRLHKGEVALLGFVGFMLLSAAITAMGRLSLGLNAAYASRYATPVFATVSALFILYRPLLHHSLAAPFWLRISVWRYIGFGLIVLALTAQKRTLEWVPERNYNHVLGALALELNIADPFTVGAIYPDADQAMMLSERARAIPQMIWAMSPIKDAKDLIGRKIAATKPSTCKMAVDTITLQVSNSSMQRWDGWIGLSPDQLIYLTDESGTVFGVGLVGGRRDDVWSVFPELHNRTGFNLYVVRFLPNDPLFLGSISERCILSEHDL